MKAGELRPAHSYSKKKKEKENKSKNDDLIKMIKNIHSEELSGT